jgi:hypothetical protein
MRPRIVRAVIRLGARGVRPRRRRPPSAAAGPNAFEVFAFVTDRGQFDELQRSFRAAGFDRFVELRDTETDPFAFISELGRRDGRAYAILTHQDVRIEHGLTAGRLLAELERLPGDWVVAGDAGGAPDLELVRRLHDPYGGSTAHPLPMRVVTLDENFLVFNNRYRPRCSPELSGFHFYGTDVCLHAARDGGTAWVIDFPVTHLSGGSKDASYEDAKRRFLEVWQRRLPFAYLRAPTEILFVSRVPFLRRLFGSPQMLRRVDDVVPSLRLDTDEPECA